MPVQVRSARADDLSLIFHANREMALETEGKELDPLTLQRGVESVLKDPSRGFYLVAELEGEPAGTLMITSEWSDWRNAQFWWIQSVYVLPRFRGQRVYRALHDEAVRQAKADSTVCGIRLYVERENSHAKQVYEKVGMTRSHYDLFEQTL